MDVRRPEVRRVLPTLMIEYVQSAIRDGGRQPVVGACFLSD